MPQPLDENYIFLTESNPYHPPTTPPGPGDALAKLFPEIVTAQGTVDPLEALAIAVDRIQRLEQQVKRMEAADGR